jgi:hypothetical protein
VVVRAGEGPADGEGGQWDGKHEKPFGRSAVNTPALLDAKQAEGRILGWQTKLHRWAGEDEE